MSTTSTSPPPTRRHITSRQRQRRVAAVSALKSLPSSVIKDIMTERVEEDTMTLLFKYICLLLKKRQCKRTIYEFHSTYFSMEIETHPRDSIHITFSWHNGIELSFPRDYIQDYHYTPEQLFSVFVWIHDHYPLTYVPYDPAYSLVRMMQRYRATLFQQQAIALWDQTKVVRRSIQNDPIVKAVHALHPIARQGLHGLMDHDAK